MAASIEPCDDGVLCPADKVCLPGGGGCATKDNVAACAALEDGASCTGDFGPGGVCRGGGCAVAQCGDGLRELDEVCDDGGVADGDGCSARCDSDETCGNGTIDTVFDEQCDHGPGLSRDGCSSTCQVELPSWRELPDATLDRVGAAVAYDSDRGRIVLFGGAVAGVPTDDTWEFDGESWHVIDVIGAPPPPRVFHAMAYDPGRHEVVMFGGAAQLPVDGDMVDLQGDLWTYAGQTWTRHTDHVGPSVMPRMKHALAYDPARATVVLAGGQGGDGEPVGGTLYRNENEFSFLPLLVDAPACDATSAAFHPGRAAIVLLCGHADQKPETLQLGAEGWSEASATTPGTRTTEGALVYDPTADALALYGSLQNDTSGYNTTAWELGATGDWMLAPARDVPHARQAPTAVYDLVAQRVVVPQLLGAGAVAETWTHTSSGGWQVLADTRPLPKLSGGALAWMPRLGRMVLVGASLDQWNVETWENSDGVWARRFPAASPTDRQNGSITFDSKRHELLLFGGGNNGDSAGRNDLWAWDGVAWNQRHDGTGAAPSPRLMANVAYDAARDGLVMFGGFDVTMGDFAAPVTWTFDLASATWTAHDVAGPSKRSPSAMAFDPSADEVLLVGGEHALADDEVVDDVWAWDGTGWTRRGDAGGPALGTSKAMAWEPTLGALVLVAGDDDEDAPLTAYVRRGDGWQAALSETAPAAADRHALAYDARARRLVSHDSNDATWAFAYINGAFPPDRCVGADLDTDEDGLAGCDDPDCWALCSPECSPAAVSCPSDAPACGDGVCNLAVEDAALCPGDCGA